MAKKTTTARGVVDAAERVAIHLEALGFDFALIGGLAVGARAEPRFTRDVDLGVSVDGDEEAERLLHAMTSRGYSIDTVIEHTKTGRLATARLRHRQDPEVFVDLLFAFVRSGVAVAVALVTGITGTARAQSHVTCVGDSITFGDGTSGAGNTYPAVLQGLLGAGYSVENDGHSGATLERDIRSIGSAVARRIRLLLG